MGQIAHFTILTIFVQSKDPPLWIEISCTFGQIFTNKRLIFMQKNISTTNCAYKFYNPVFNKKKSREKRSISLKIPPTVHTCKKCKKISIQRGGSLDSNNSFKFWGLLCTTKLGSVGGPGTNYYNYIAFFGIACIVIASVRHVSMP